MTETTEQAIERALASTGEEHLTCATAFRLAEELGASPQEMGRAADALGVRLAHCQLGLFGYGEPKRVVQPAETVAADLEEAIKGGLILGRLPCAVAWSIANRFALTKREVADAAETLNVRISQCQLGAF